MDRIQKLPDAAHPITIAPAGGRVLVTLGDTVIADTRSALALREASYPPVFYIPRADVDRGVLSASATTSYCPYKGDATYHSFTAETAVADAAWSYEQPFRSVGEIAGHLAFYLDRVTIAAGPR